jgi:beta-glucosidase
MFGSGIGLFGQRGPTQQPLYLDPQQPVEARVKDLMSRLSVVDKATLLDRTIPLTRLNIEATLGWNQCLHGVLWNRPTTMFPSAIAMGATWDPALINEVATVISDEARAIWNEWHANPNFTGNKLGLVYRSPVINISRNPFWGRIQEIYSEDPYLTGRLGVAFVKGLQGNDPKYLKLVSTLKHYAVNNIENIPEDRHRHDAKVSERWLFEYWLPHFRDGIVEGKAQSVMASYNAINGVDNVRNKYLLTDILKNQWGFEGFVVNDASGVSGMHDKYQGKISWEEAVAQSLIGGCDVADAPYGQYIPIAVGMGILPMERVDDAVYRVMRDRFRTGEFDPPAVVPYSKIPFSVVCSPEHRALSLKVAQKSIVLLKNKDNFLPLDKNNIKTIAVIGPHANIFTSGGYSGIAANPVTPLQGIYNRAEYGTEILYAAGAQIPSNQKPATTTNATGTTTAVTFNREEELKKAVEIAQKADVIILYVGTTTATEAEGRDRTTLALVGNQEELVEAVMKVNPKTIVVEMNAGPLAVPWIKENVPAIIEAWWPGEEGGNAIADVIFGNVNPSGKMPLTVYASDKQVPPLDEYDISKGFTYMYLKGAPLFPFGHGLSYTKFAYSNMTISSKNITKDGQVNVSVNVKNTGSREGDEVVQLYIHDVVCSVIRATKELRGFKRINLKPGETKTVTMTVPGEKLAFYDEKTHQFVVEPGTFDVLVGSSSEDIRLKGQFDVVSK